MSGQSQPLLTALHRRLAEVYADSNGRPSAASLGEMAGQLMSSSLTVLGHRSPDQRHAMQWWPKELDLHRFDAAYETHVHTHPVRNRFRATKRPGPYTVSDVQTLPEFKSSALYCDYFRHFGVTRMMAIYAPLGDSSHVSLGVSRDGSDFSDEERMAFASFQPHFAAAALREATSASGRILVLDERNQNPLATLTPREAEVFRWMAEGKTNSEIALILGRSRLTVKTHVERILRKVGAENRVAAIAAAYAWNR